MKPLPAPKYIVWSCDPSRLDQDDPWVRRWWIEQVLNRGRLKDVRDLDLDEVRRVLPTLRLAEAVRALWTRYFNDPRPANRPDVSSVRPA